MLALGVGLEDAARVVDVFSGVFVLPMAMPACDVPVPMLVVWAASVAVAWLVWLWEERETNAEAWADHSKVEREDREDEKACQRDA